MKSLKHETTQCVWALQIVWDETQRVCIGEEEAAGEAGWGRSRQGKGQELILHLLHYVTFGHSSLPAPLFLLIVIIRLHLEAQINLLIHLFTHQCVLNTYLYQFLCRDRKLQGHNLKSCEPF